MGTHIETAIFENEGFRSLDDTSKIMFLFLQTTERTNMTIGEVTATTGIPMTIARVICEEFEEDGILTYKNGTIHLQGGAPQGTIDEYPRIRKRTPQGRRTRTP